ncbi:ankyrin repeat-containing domain protein [Lasiosphaeris hirsuta]|uniref:Ankyrin repeat-containing domain protein n=1 Tax=Lasiosphaeris hirsuta TaxID=260670 RepID=A0AA39ZSA8_9PEZI|nr:ankyrin repeat-containing domain protein [Lasiosphaeris hirsuta]
MNGSCVSPLPDLDPHPSQLPATTKPQHGLSPNATALTTDNFNMNLNYVVGARGCSLNDSNRGKTVLHMSAERGNVRLVEMMLDHGVDVDGADGCGRTALHYAAGGAHVEVVARLLAAGADPEVRNHEGISPLHAAAYVECEPIIELLRRVGVDLNAGIGVTSSNSSKNEKDGGDKAWPEWGST